MNAKKYENNDPYNKSKDVFLRKNKFDLHHPSLRQFTIPHHSLHVCLVRYPKD